MTFPLFFGMGLIPTFVVMKQSCTIPVTKTAKYYTLGEIGPKISRVIFALHGYGQSADSFIHKFEDVSDEKTLVVCPEGLSRFYWNGFTGDVVASWMTKKDREDDIKDNMAYLDQLYHHIISQLEPKPNISVLGFSQGCPTASRWLAHSKFACNNLVLWGGQLAHDVDFKSAENYFSDINLKFVYGDEDKFIQYGYVERQHELSKSNNLEFDTHIFNGKHEINRNTLKEVFTKLWSVKKLF